MVDRSVARFDGPESPLPSSSSYMAVFDPYSSTACLTMCSWGETAM